MSNKFEGMSADQVYTAVVADGIVDADEVVALDAYIFADGVVDADEFGLMTRLNDHVADSENAGHAMPEFTALYVKTTASFVLEDDNTPGIVDEGEGQTLMAAWKGDGQFDAREKAAASAIRARTTGPLPAALDQFMTAHGV